MDLFLLVEGDDDDRFCGSVITPERVPAYSDVSTWQWSPRKTTVTDERFIDGVVANGDDYFLLADLDDLDYAESRREAICQRFSSCDRTHVIVVERAIEAWYVAGLDLAVQTALKIDRGRIPNRTDDFRKADLRGVMPSRYKATNAFLRDVLRRFSIAEARGRNRSFDDFARRIGLHA
jgi:hypothetical protein